MEQEDPHSLCDGNKESSAEPQVQSKPTAHLLSLSSQGQPPPHPYLSPSPPGTGQLRCSPASGRVSRRSWAGLGGTLPGAVLSDLREQAQGAGPGNSLVPLPDPDSSPYPAEQEIALGGRAGGEWQGSPSQEAAEG